MATTRLNVGPGGGQTADEIFQVPVAALPVEPCDGVVLGIGIVVAQLRAAKLVAGAQHLHLGQEDLADADLNEIRKARLTLGISTHDDEELATALRAKPDYVALGPIFPTTLKSMRFAPQGIAKITEWKKRVGNIPLVAIGGIKFEQSAEIFAAGADSIAVVSDVTQNADPDARVRQWLGQSAEAA